MKYTLKRRPLAAAVALGLATSALAGQGAASAVPGNPQTVQPDNPQKTNPQPNNPQKTQPEAKPEAPANPQQNEPRVAPPENPQKTEPAPKNPQTGPSGNGQQGEPQAPAAPQGGESAPKGDETAPKGEGGEKAAPDATPKGEDTAPGEDAPKSAPKAAPKSAPESAPGAPFVTADIEVFGLPYLQGPTAKNPGLSIGWTDGLPEGPKLPPAPKAPEWMPKLPKIELPPPPVVINIVPTDPGAEGGRAPEVTVTSDFDKKAE